MLERLKHHTDQRLLIKIVSKMAVWQATLNKSCQDQRFTMHTIARVTDGS